MIKVVVTDIDGTFADDKGKVTPETMAAVELAKTKGVKLCFASGRELRSMRSFINTFSTNSFNMIGCNGAVISVENEIILEESIPQIPALEINDLAEKYGLHIQFFWGNRRAIPERCTTLPAHCTADGEVFDLVGDLKPLIADNLPLNILLTDIPQRILKVKRELELRYTDILQITRSGPSFLDIFPRGSNKGNGLRAVCENLGVDLSETVAFGNGENDLEMIIAAGIGVAMENSPDILRNSANIIAPSNNNNGFAVVLNRLLDIQ